MTLPDEISPTHDSTTTPTVEQRPVTQQNPATSSLESAIAQKKTSGLKRSATVDGAKPSAKKSISYADAGVDITSGDRSKQRIKMLARKTFNRQVLS